MERDFFFFFFSKEMRILLAWWTKGNVLNIVLMPPKPGLVKTAWARMRSSVFLNTKDGSKRTYVYSSIDNNTLQLEDPNSGRVNCLQMNLRY